MPVIHVHLNRTRDRRKAKDAETVRQMRNRLFAVNNQSEPANRYYPNEAKSGETVEAMRHRLFNLEPQDGPYSQAR